MIFRTTARRDRLAVMALPVDEDGVTDRAGVQVDEAYARAFEAVDGDARNDLPRRPPGRPPGAGPDRSGLLGGRCGAGRCGGTGLRRPVAVLRFTGVLQVVGADGPGGLGPAGRGPAGRGPDRSGRSPHAQQRPSARGGYGRRRLRAAVRAVRSPATRGGASSTAPRRAAGAFTAATAYAGGRPVRIPRPGW